jgi:hypothetical protein
MLQGMRKCAFGAAAAAALFVIPVSAFSQSVEIGPGGVRVRGGECEQLACLRKQGRARRAGRRKLPQIPGDLPTTSSERCVRRIATSLPQQGPIGRTRRRKLPQISRDLQRALVKGADCQCCRVVRHRPAHRSSRRPPQLAAFVHIEPSLRCRAACVWNRNIFQPE